MNSRTMALAAVALVMVAAAGIAVYITTDDEYSISYELNGGTQNQLNPTTYTEGKRPPATSRCMRVGPTLSSARPWSSR